MITSGPNGPADPGGASRLRATFSPGTFYVSDLAAQLAAAIVAVVCTCFGLLATLAVVEVQGWRASPLAVVAALATLGLQLGYFSRPRARFTRWRTLVALVLQAALVFLPIPVYGSFWLGFPGFLTASLLLALPALASVPLAILNIVAAVTLQIVYSDPVFTFAYSLVYTGTSTLLTGLIIYGLSRLARLVTELHDARDELSRMAVAEERLRWARDTHDLLGMSLSAITLKNELGHRLLTVDPVRAKIEISEALGVARKALSDVRMIASGRNTLSLADELLSARSVLSAADVEVTSTLETETWSDATGAILATALREAITNVLRHSTAGAVTIRLWAETDAGTDTVVLSVGNDGVDPDHVDEGAGSGRGLGNLTRRFAEQGGHLSVAQDAGTFTLTLSVPAVLQAA